MSILLSFFLARGDLSDYSVPTYALTGSDHSFDHTDQSNYHTDNPPPPNLPPAPIIPASPTSVSLDPLFRPPSYKYRVFIKYCVFFEDF